MGANDGRKYIRQGQGTVTVADRRCEICSNSIGVNRRSDTKYCSKPCRTAAQTGKRRAARIAYAIEVADDPSNVHSQRGKVYNELIRTGYAKAIAEGEMTAASAAQILSVTQAAVSKAMGAYRQQLAIDVSAEGWEMDPTIAAMFPKDYIEDLRRIGLDSEGTFEFERMLGRVTEAFWIAQHRYFTIGSRQSKMIVKWFHEEMLRELVLSHVFALRVLLLTPPRHGKSEILIRFYWWLMVMNPNHQILWVAANTDLAGDMGRKLRATFEHNKLMNDELLPPGVIFGSERTSKPWTDNRFTLDTRTDPTLKSSSFTGLGATSTIAGRDADEIGVDDLEERKTVTTEDLRQTSREKHSEVMERKEDHTGVCTIASRQHLDDIPSRLMRQHGVQKWRVKSYTAHSEDCELDAEDPLGHDTNGCVLFPEVRPYRWLLEQKEETEDLGLPGRFQLRYLQKAVPIEGNIFEVPLIREKTLDRSRIAGRMDQLPAGKMIGGLDPAPRGNQAGFCWLWTPKTQFMVDLEVQKAGGIAGALALMRDWHGRFGLTDWYYEDNSGQIEFFRDPRFFELRHDLGLQILPHTTGKNKHDPELGISSMAPDYHSGFINLPYGDPESRRKVNLLLGELELWTDGGIAKRGRSDIKMASWFPYPRMQRWRATSGERKKMKISQSDYPRSYPEIDGFSKGIGKAPW